MDSVGVSGSALWETLVKVPFMNLTRIDTCLGSRMCHGMRHVVRISASRAIPPTFIVGPSLFAAEPSQHNLLCIETDEPAPVSNLRRSKLAGEVGNCGDQRS
ncbi:hypothetical protein SAMN06265222_101935 [Neorhodopirellula lusitana]|uniref:Uncharacterized protein n=1 Tax=Neorhodopirellula lusitana TaxID=445327 RepID=A0ABY1PR22_9BACT|nr:hypothetical protein SAMN06265222_101935 [Neorhodopirellula lusitana]